MTLLDLLLAILCAYRLTQLLTWDDLLSPVTCWLANKHRLLDELFGCPHCMGFWCSLASVVAVTQDYWLIRIGVWAFAVSGAVSMIQHATGWLDTEVPVQHFTAEGDVGTWIAKLTETEDIDPGRPWTIGHRHMPEGEGE